MQADVRFDSAGLTLAGTLYRPDDETTAPGPALVVGHPASGVKEQAAGRYARELAARGFVTLAFDAAYQGESGGWPRGLEDPAHRVEDIKAATSFLAGADGVDPGRIGAVGICASGGYLVTAAAADQRLRAVATVSAVDIGAHFREGAAGDQDPAVLTGLLAQAAAARTAEAAGAEPPQFPVFPSSAEQARALGPHVFEGWEYYRTDRGQHPRSATTMPWRSVDLIATFDAFAFIGLIAPRPLLMIAGRRAVTAQMTTRAFARAGAGRELAWIDGASHVDLYDKPQYVNPALDRLVTFFRTALA